IWGNSSAAALLAVIAPYSHKDAQTFERLREMSQTRLIKNKFYRFYVANEVIIGNAVALLAGDWLTNILFENRAGYMPDQLLEVFYYLDLFYGMVCAVVMSTLIILYERPVRKALKAMGQGRQETPEVVAKARKRILNEPYFIVIMDAIAWSIGSFLFWAAGSPGGLGLGLGSGMITVTLAFFWVEHVSQHTRVPLFFPKGDLSSVRGVKSTSLRVRFMALIFAVSLVPLAFIHLTIHRYRQLQEMGEMTLATLLHRLEETIVHESAIFMVVAIIISVLVLHHLKKPLEEIIRVMAHVKRGDFSQKARVYTNDEIGFAGEMLNAMNQGLVERELIKDTFGKYVDRRIRDEILTGRIPLDGERMEATILFADLRNFTPLVAVTPAKELIYMLNSYFNEISRVIDRNGGLILQFIGDEVEAVFGAPVARQGHETAAVETALEMRGRLDMLNKRFQDRDLPPIAHGVGIHTGPVLAANIGSAYRSTYSLIGDTVNMASRIQGLTKECRTDILVSEAMHQRLKDQFSFVPMKETRVKGKSDPIRVYSLQS
ncbi:MAG: HAMP domain-containing protein, partial [Desulfobacterales bacterium]|nr:HAMP domain-containing protein [Desulfobacterales bacterium]